MDIIGKEEKSLSAMSGSEDSHTERRLVADGANLWGVTPGSPLQIYSGSASGITNHMPVGSVQTGSWVPGVTPYINPNTYYTVIGTDIYSANVTYKDDQGNFHREDGPALIWNDGRAKYYWHGKFIGEI